MTTLADAALTANAPTASEPARALHAALLTARRAHRSAEHRLAHLLAELSAGRHHLALGYASVCHYAEVVLELSIRQTRALLALGRRLPELPTLDRAFAAGELGWTKARELLRIVTPETEAAWVEHAKERTSRELEGDIVDAVVGDEPEAKDRKGPARRRIVFEVDATDEAYVRRAIALMRSQVELNRDEIEDGALLGLMARRVVHDIEEDETPSVEPYRIVLQHCPSCGETEGLDTEVRDTIIAEAACNHDVVELRPGPDRGKRVRSIPPRRRRAVLLRDQMRCAIPGCRCRIWLDIHHLKPWAEGGDHAEDNLLTLCPAHHRVVHDGVLAVTRDSDGRVVVEHADGRRRVGETVTHVGREGPRSG